MEAEPDLLSLGQEIDADVVDANSDGLENIFTSLELDSEPSCSYSSPRLGQSSVVTPGVKDSEGFLTPPPASTLLIRRTRNNSAGSSTYVIASPPGPGPISAPMNPNLDPLPSSSTSCPAAIPPPLPPLDIPREFSVPYRRLHKRSSRDRKSEPSLKRYFDSKKVNVLLTPQQNPHVQINVPSGNGLHHRSSFPPISPLAIDPSHALSVTLSADRSISTVVPIDTFNSQPSTSTPVNPFVFPPPYPPSTSSSNLNSYVTEMAGNSSTNHKDPIRQDEKPPAVFRGKPATFMASTETEGHTSYSSGKGNSSEGKRGGGVAGKKIKRKRGERGPDRFPNIDPATGRRRYIRKKRFTLDKKQTSRGRLHGRSQLGGGQWMSYDHDLAGKWRPTDDLRLIVNVLQINDLEMVHRGVRFSCKFTLENIEKRWGGLLYDKAISKVSQNSIENLHPRVVASIHENALFSAEEDRVLKTVRSTHDPTTVRPVLEKLLKDNALVFIKWRTPKCLLEHWLHLREYHLLCDQNVKDYFDQESFSEFENNLTEQAVRENNELDSNVRREMLIENRHSKKMIRTLEEEVSRWQVLADMVTEIDQTPFEEGSFAMLRGKQVRYLMRSREITLGRRTPASVNVDADLSLEGSTYKVSRKQATIQLRTLGDFAILNQGKHGIYVDGNVIMPRKLGVLVDQSVIEISQLRFVFLINHKLVAEQRKKWIRVEVKKEMLRLAKIARFIKAHPAYPMAHPSHPFMQHPPSPSPGDPAPIGLSTDQVPSSQSPSFSNNALATIDCVASNNSGGEASSSSTTRFTGSLTRPPQPPKYPNNGNIVGSSTTFIKSYVPPILPPPSSMSIPRITSPGPLFRKPAPPPPFPQTAPSYENSLSHLFPRGFHTSTTSLPPPYSSSSVPTSLGAISIRAPPKIEKPKVPKTPKHVSIHSTTMKSTSGYPMVSPGVSTMPSVPPTMSTTPSNVSPSTMSSVTHPASVISRTPVWNPMTSAGPPQIPVSAQEVTPNPSAISMVLTPVTPMPPAYTLPNSGINNFPPVPPPPPTVIITPGSTSYSVPQIPSSSGALNDLNMRQGQPPSSQDSTYYKNNPL